MVAAHSMIRRSRPRVYACVALAVVPACVLPLMVPLNTFTSADYGDGDTQGRVRYGVVVASVQPDEARMSLPDRLVPRPDASGPGEAPSATVPAASASSAAASESIEPEPRLPVSPQALAVTSATPGGGEPRSASALFSAAMRLLGSAGIRLEAASVTVVKDGIQIRLPAHDARIPTVARLFAAQWRSPWLIMIEPSARERASHAAEGDRKVVLTGATDVQLPGSSAGKRALAPCTDWGLGAAMGTSEALPCAAAAASAASALRQQAQPRPQSYPLLSPQRSFVDLYQMLEIAASRVHVAPALLAAVAWVESRGHHTTDGRTVLVSPAGARGLMQLMPSTAADMGANPDDLVQNVAAGAAYLGSLLVRYQGRTERALAAYNCGPACVDAAVVRGGESWLAFVPDETAAYVRRVMQKDMELAPGRVTPVS